MSEITQAKNAEKLAVASISRDLITWSAIAFTVMATIGWLSVNGSAWWPAGNSAIWSSEIWTRANSQHPLDPYTLTHMMHGVLCFWTLSLIAKRLPLSRQFFLAILCACAWELIENSPLFIERFRVVTAASEYVGDAMVNSMIDIAACGTGFFLASKCRYSISILIFCMVEIVTAFWVRDNLLLNVLMLVFPVDSVRNWQIGI